MILHTFLLNGGCFSCWKGTPFISGIPLQQNKSHKGCGWNSLPLEVKSSPSLNIFKSKLKTHLFKCAFNLN